MTFEEWRSRFASHGLPVLAIVESPRPEFNAEEDLFSPTLAGPLGQHLAAQKADIPAQCDLISIEDMKDPGFAAARFASNKLDAMDAAVRYQRKFVGDYRKFTSALRAAQKGRR